MRSAGRPKGAQLWRDPFNYRLNVTQSRKSVENGFVQAIGPTVYEFLDPALAPRISAAPCVDARRSSVFRSEVYNSFPAPAAAETLPASAARQKRFTSRI
jgi:hypothetical protein